MLTEMGFTDVQKVAGNPTADDQVNLVTEVSPTGKKVKFTQQISVTYNVAFNAPNAPAAPTVASQQVDSGAAFTANLSTAGVCPTGLSAGDFTVTVEGGGTLASLSGSTANLQAGALTPGAANDTIRISYTVTCNGNGVSKVSPASAVTTVTVKAPPAPDPSDSDSDSDSAADGNAAANG